MIYLRNAVLEPSAISLFECHNKLATLCRSIPVNGQLFLLGDWYVRHFPDRIKITTKLIHEDDLAGTFESSCDVSVIMYYKDQSWKVQFSADAYRHKHWIRREKKRLERLFAPYLD